MSDRKPSLSEISHLFLSDVRQRAGSESASARPRRIPPRSRPDVSVDLTPEEFAAGLDAEAGDEGLADSRPTDSPAGGVRASVLLASHLAEQPAERVRLYARHIAAACGRTGLIEADCGEFRIDCFEAGGHEAATPVVLDELNGRRMAETMAELAFDVDRWLIWLPNPRTSEAHDILRQAPHWVLLTTADHEGVVATYRVLKGLAELGKPRVSLVVLDARDEAQAEAVFNKLSAVSRQFLDCRMQSESPMRPVGDVTEHHLLMCRAMNDKAQLATAPQWEILSDLLSRAVAPRGEEMDVQEPLPEGILEDAPMTHPDMKIATAAESVDEVIDLPDTAESSVLEAIAGRGAAMGQWISSPIKAPACPQAVVAVGRDRRLLLLAVAGTGLKDLRAIGLSLRWMEENRELIRMALPQLAIDPTAPPAVRLLVDHADLSADVLLPLLQSSAVTVQAYRRVKWGSRNGLLLEAA